MTSSEPTSGLPGVDDEVEEVWQNQSFIPFRGWGKPFSVVKEYSDRSGTQGLSNDLFPSIPLPEGWEWSTEWMVDIFGSFGAIDMDGWCYGLTWDGLFDSVRDCCSVGDNTTACLCRRKRWIRVRKCVSEAAGALCQDAAEEQLDVLVWLERSLLDKTHDYEHVMQYELERRSIYEKVTSTCLADVLVVYQSFLEYQRVLRLLQVCLQEQALLESQYALALGAHAARFASLLAPPADSCPPPPPRAAQSQRSASLAMYNTIGAMEVPPVQHSSSSSSNSDSSSSSCGPGHHDDTETTTRPRSDSMHSVDDMCDHFFSAMNKVNSAAALKWTDYSTFISSSVVEDVAELLSRVTEQLRVAKRFVYWSDVNAAPILSKLESSVVTLQHTYFASADKIKTRMNKLSSKLFSGSDGPAGVEVSAGVRAGRRSSLDQRRSIAGLAAASASPSSARSSPPPAARGKGEDEQVLDMWTSMKSYRKNVISLGNELSLLGSTAHKLLSKEQEYGRAVRHLFLASAQVVSHEKARICMEMGEIMNNDRKQLVAHAAELEKQQQLLEEGGGSGDGNNSNSNSNSCKDATLVFTPATELPKFHNQILLMSIMQYTSLSEAKRISQLESDQGGAKTASKEGILSIKAVVTTDGVLHIFLLQDKLASGGGSSKSKSKDDEDTPFRSLLLEDCKIVRHFEEKDKRGSGEGGLVSASFENAVEVHPRSAETDWFGGRKHEALVLIPIDSMESETWVEVLTNPLCGAHMLYSALGGRPVPSSRRGSNVYARRASLARDSGGTGMPPTQPEPEHPAEQQQQQHQQQQAQGEQQQLSHYSTTETSSRNKTMNMSSLFPSVDLPPEAWHVV